MIHIYYNDQCQRCRKFIRIIKLLCVMEKIQYMPLQKADPDSMQLSAEQHSWVVKIGWWRYTKGEALLRLLSKSKPWWPLFKILCIWPIRWITFPMANFAYRRLQPKAS